MNTLKALAVLLLTIIFIDNVHANNSRDRQENDVNLSVPHHHDQATQTDEPPAPPIRLENSQIKNILITCLQDLEIAPSDVLITIDTIREAVFIKMLYRPSHVMLLDQDPEMGLLRMFTISAQISIAIEKLKILLPIIGDNRTIEEELAIAILSNPTNTTTHRRLRQGQLTALLQASSQSAACSICLNGIRRNSRRVVLPCTHHFHHTCIRRWVVENSNTTCPTCRQELPEQED